MANKRRKGNSLVLVLVFTGAILVIVLAIFRYTQTNSTVSTKRVNDQNVTRIADAGIEKAAWCLNHPTVTTSECDMNNYANQNGNASGTLGNGSYTISVSGNGSSRIVQVAGTQIGSGGTSSKTVQATLLRNGSAANFNYGMQVGTGGIVMNNSSKIIGNVFANGSVTGNNSATITGDVVLAVGDATTNVSVDPAPNGTTSFGQTSPNTKYVVQSFVPTVTDKLYEIDLKVARTSLLPANINLKLYSDNAVDNRPLNQIATTTVGASIFPVNVAGWDGAWTEVSFPPTSLTSGTKYWIVLEVNSTDNSKIYTVLNATSDVYAGNTAKIGSNLTSGLAQLGSIGTDIAFQVKMGGTFPTLSMSGGIGGSVKSHTINGTTVGGDAYYQALVGTVKANGGSETCSMVPGTRCHPVTTEETPAAFPLTSAQINGFELDAADGTPIGATTWSNGTHNLGPAVVNGDLELTNDAQIILTGAVWVKGNISIENTSKIILSDSYGTDSGVIIAHDPDNPTIKGKIEIENSAAITGNSNPDTYILTIAMSNDLSGSAINLANSQTGTIFYAPNGNVTLNNTAGLQELVAKKITMNNTATITYSDGLADEFFTSGPGGSWTYQKGTYQIL